MFRSHLECEGEGTGALRRVAEALMSGVTATGLCALGIPRSPTEDGGWARRLALTGSLLRYLEREVGLRFGASPLPYLYHSQGWPSNARPAGYVAESPEVRPSDVYMSYRTAWTGQVLHETKGLIYLRPLKAADWMAQEHGLARGVRYLLDLQASGFILRGSITNVLLHLLNAAATRARGTQTVTDVLFGSRLGTDPLAWPPVEESALRGVSGHAEDPGAPVIEPAIEHLLERIEIARSANDLDGWLMAQFALGSEARVVCGVTRKLIEAPTLPLQVILDQAEEMQIDAWVLKGSLAASLHHPLAFPSSALTAAWFPYRERDPENWRKRFRQERALLPRAVAEPLLDGEHASLSTEWRWVSPSLAAVIGQFLARRDPCLIVANVEGGKENSREALDQLGSIAEAGDSCGNLGRLRSLSTEYPWCRFARHEFAIALDETGQHHEALAEMEASVGLEPLSPLSWQSLGVVLKNLGSAEEATLALAIAALIRQSSKSGGTFRSPGSAHN